MDAEIHDISVEDQGPFLSMKYNSVKTLSDLTFGSRASGYEKLAEKFFSDPLHIEKMADSQANSKKFYNLQMQTRSLMLQGLYADAARLFAEYIQIDGLDIAQMLKVGPNEDLLIMMKKWREEIAREYRDFGVSILKSGIPNSLETAVVIWKAV